MKAESTDRSFPTRRNVLRIVAVGGAAAVAWRLGLLDRRRGGGPVTRSRVLMGTQVNLTVLADDRDAAEAAAEATLARMAELESILSTYRPDSELSRLNDSGHLEQAHDAVLDVLRLADEIHRLGDGAFDLTVQPVVQLYKEQRSRLEGLPAPEAIEQRLELVGFRRIRVEGHGVRLERPGMQLTLDGIGKGWIVDRGVEVLRRRGFANVFVEAGGDLVASGDKGSGTPWRIGIRGPRPGLALQAKFDTRDRAVATSGDYMQPFADDYSQHHILDPRTGHSSPELASSTVIAPDAAMADGLATLTMVLGHERGRELVEDLPDCEAYFVRKDLEVVRTSGFSVV